MLCPKRYSGVSRLISPVALSKEKFSRWQRETLHQISPTFPWWKGQDVFSPLATCACTWWAPSFPEATATILAHGNTSLTAHCTTASLLCRSEPWALPCTQHASLDWRTPGKCGFLACIRSGCPIRPPALEGRGLGICPLGSLRYSGGTSYQSRSAAVCQTLSRSGSAGGGQEVSGAWGQTAMK